MAAQMNGSKGESQDEVLAAAQGLADQHRYAACLALLDGYSSPGSCESVALKAMRLISTILLHADKKDWWKVSKDMQFVIKNITRLYHCLTSYGGLLTYCCQKEEWLPW